MNHYEFVAVLVLGLSFSIMSLYSFIIGNLIPMVALTILSTIFFIFAYREARKRGLI